MTTTEQYAQRIRAYMASRPTTNRSDFVLALIQIKVETGGTFEDVKRVLAAEKLLHDETFAALDATVAEVRAAQQEESTR